MRIMKEGSTLNRRDAAIGSTTGCARVIHCGPLPGRPRSAAEREEREDAWLALSRPRRWLVVRAGEWCGVVWWWGGKGRVVEWREDRLRATSGSAIWAEAKRNAGWLRDAGDTNKTPAACQNGHARRSMAGGCLTAQSTAAFGGVGSFRPIHSGTHKYSHPAPLHNPADRNGD